MTPFTRSTARDFRALLARCVSGRPRGPAPPVVIRTKGEVRTLAATTPEGVTLTHAAPAVKEADDLLVLPAAVLAEVEGGTDEAVALDRESKLRGVLRWSGGSTPRTLPVELILPGQQHELPPAPALSISSGKLLTALHECGRTAARESGRYALSKVQVQGKSGRVVGTDGKAALLWAGFPFPFADDVLVPAVPVFGAKPLARIPEVKLGRTATHLVVTAVVGLAADRHTVQVSRRRRGHPALRPDHGGDRPGRRRGAAPGPARPARRGPRAAPRDPRREWGGAGPRPDRGWRAERGDQGTAATAFDCHRPRGPRRPRQEGAGPRPGARVPHPEVDPRQARRLRRRLHHARRGAARPGPVCPAGRRRT